MGEVAQESQSRKFDPYLPEHVAQLLNFTLPVLILTLIGSVPHTKIQPKVHLLHANVEVHCITDCLITFSFDIHPSGVRYGLWSWRKAGARWFGNGDESAIA